MANKDVKNKQEQQQQKPQGAISRLNDFGGLGFPLILNPFLMMRKMNEEISRLSEESGSSGRFWAPTIEVSREGDNLLVRAELPGLKPDDVKVEIESDTLVLSGERKFERDESKGGVQQTERRYGRFYRAIALPEEANPDEGRARFENGILEITIPLREPQTNRKQIPVEGASTPTPEKAA